MLPPLLAAAKFEQSVASAINLRGKLTDLCWRPGHEAGDSKAGKQDAKIGSRKYGVLSEGVIFGGRGLWLRYTRQT